MPERGIYPRVRIVCIRFVEIEGILWIEMNGSLDVEPCSLYVVQDVSLDKRHVPESDCPGFTARSSLLPFCQGSFRLIITQEISQIIMRMRIIREILQRSQQGFLGNRAV